MNPTLKLLLTGVRYTTTSISTAKYEVSIRVFFVFFIFLNLILTT